MKKQIVWIFVGIVILGGLLTYMKSKQNSHGELNSSESHNGDLKLRVAFPSTRAALSYDPVNIHLDYEYIFLENIYSPLVEFDAQGVLKPGVAEKIENEGNQVVLTIRNMKTENGTPITAADVAFSLKRLLVLTGNTHGNFRNLVCPGVTLKSVEDSCPGIEAHGDKLILKTKGPSTFLLPMLAAIDFAIIPRSSVNPKTLKIVNMKETSGPYYVDSDDGKGDIVLKLNPYHYHAADVGGLKVAREIDLIPITGSESSLQALLKNKVDHVTTIDAARSDAVLEFKKEHPDFNYHVTRNIRLLFLKFTDVGLKKFSGDERRLIASKVRSAFLSIYKNVPGTVPIDEFFPSLADGELDSVERGDLTKINEKLAKKLPINIRIGLLKANDINEWQLPLQKVIPTAHSYQLTDVPTLAKNQSDMPDAYIGGTDTGFMEDIGLISYSLNAGTFGLTKAERGNWLAKYMSTESKPARMKVLRELQFNALASPVIVPLIASPYTAIVRKPWTMELSNLYADDQLWRIKHQ